MAIQCWTSMGNIHRHRLITGSWPVLWDPKRTEGNTRLLEKRTVVRWHGGGCPLLSSGATTLKKVRRWFPGCFFLRCHRKPLWCYFLRHKTDLSAFLLAPSIFVSKTRVAQRCAARVRCCRAPPTQPPNDDVLLLSSSFSFSAETSTDSFARFLSAWCILATNYGDGDFFGTSDFCWWADTKIASSSKGIFWLGSRMPCNLVSCLTWWHLFISLVWAEPSTFLS